MNVLWDIFGCVSTFFSYLDYVKVTISISEYHHGILRISDYDYNWISSCVLTDILTQSSAQKCPYDSKLITGSLTTYVMEIFSMRSNFLMVEKKTAHHTYTGSYWSRARDIRVLITNVLTWEQLVFFCPDRTITFRHTEKRLEMTTKSVKDSKTQYEVMSPSVLKCTNTSYKTISLSHNLIHTQIKSILAIRWESDWNVPFLIYYEITE